MNLLDLATECGALGGYTIGATGQDATNKTRSVRRIKAIKADIISRYGGKWDANLREGWLPIVPLYNTGTATFTLASRTVTGSGTTWTTAMKGRKITGPDGAAYKIASVASTTSLVITQPYQGPTSSGATYQIWKDEYRLYPEVLTLGNFTNYYLPSTTREAWAREMKDSFPNEKSNQEPGVHQVVTREKFTAIYSTGTVSGTINTNVITGVGTSWLDNVEPGFEITIGSYTYHVLRVNSDTEIELYQLLVATATTATYSTVGKNSLVVRFNSPATQRVLSYWYWAKDYPFVNDNDEDWIAEAYPRVLIDGMAYFDYLDKNDVPRAMNSRAVYESSIKDMKVAVDSAYGGVRTLPMYLPDAARD
jgi:hypothetical protein